MNKISRFILSAIVVVGLSATGMAQAAALKSNHPDRYVVKKGDTLWDISGMFLQKPWLWPEIWHVNPQIANPHLIYPGDELELVYLDGRAVLRRMGGPGRLSPGVRRTPWDGAIATVPVDAIAPFLSRPYVVDQKTLNGAPYIVAFADEHIVGGAGQRIYVRTVEDENQKEFDVVRAGGPYKDADSGEILGYEALFVGSANVQRTGDPATLKLISTEMEVVKGDLLLAAIIDEAIGDFYPKVPAQEVHGSIISVLNGVSQIGQYNIIVIDRGAVDGLSPGSVLQIDNRGETIKDPVARSRTSTTTRISALIDSDLAKESAREQPKVLSNKVTLPDEKAGLAMVFRTFDRVSFAIVMDATRSMRVLDRVHNPD